MNASIVVLDANLPEENIGIAIELCRRHNVPGMCRIYI